jgi:hypothetical protein
MESECSQRLESTTVHMHFSIGMVTCRFYNAQMTFVKRFDSSTLERRFVGVGYVKPCLRVDFQGIDAGGVAREWWQCIIEDVFGPALGTQTCSLHT